VAEVTFLTVEEGLVLGKGFPEIFYYFFGGEVLEI